MAGIAAGALGVWHWEGEEMVRLEGRLCAGGQGPPQARTTSCGGGGGRPPYVALGLVESECHRVPASRPLGFVLSA